MFEAQTYDKVLEEILSRAPDGIDLRQGSIFYDAVAGIAFKIAKYYADLEQVFEMVFLVTATGDYLTLKAEEYAVYRQAAATAKYRIKYDGELPELGTRFFCSGQYFVLAQDDALGIYIEAEKAGTEANDIPAGTSVVPTDTQRSLTACSIVEELEPGADDEDDESLRKRVQEKIAGPAENGNQQHYKTWCESISGVGRARIVPLWAGENTVKGILIDTEGGPASEAVVQRVQEYIDPGGTGLGEGQANIGAHFTATSATAKRVNISFSVTLAKGGDLRQRQECSADGPQSSNQEHQPHHGRQRNAHPAHQHGRQHDLQSLGSAGLRKPPLQRPDGKRRGRKRGGICFGGGDSK